MYNKYSRLTKIHRQQRIVLAIVVQTTSELPLFALAMALIDVAASIVATPVLVEVGA
jgi:hypothetical protein